MVKRKANNKGAPERQKVPLIPMGGGIQFGQFQAKCGAKANIFTSKKAVPVIVIFVNIGICSLDVTINGGPPFQIPSRARRPDILGDPAATSIDVDCVMNVPGGDCDYFFFLITL